MIVVPQFDPFGNFLSNIDPVFVLDAIWFVGLKKRGMIFVFIKCSQFTVGGAQP